MQESTKNGLPWTGLYKFPKPPNPEYIERLHKVWLDEDWGVNYENNRRHPIQSAIYPCTRTVTWDAVKGSVNKEFAEISTVIGNEIKQMFPIPMTPVFSEMVLLVPNGTIPWHHDRMTICSLATRVMIPCTQHEEEIDYYFASWSDDTPTNSFSFSVLPYLGKDVHVGKMEAGNYYAFNHRVPHSTISKSSKPRGLMQMDLVPTEIYESYELINGKAIKDAAVHNWSKVFAPISEQEKRPLLPLMI